MRHSTLFLIASSFCFLTACVGTSQDGVDPAVCAQAQQHVQSCLPALGTLSGDCDETASNMSAELLGMDCQQLTNMFSSEVGWYDSAKKTAGDAWGWLKKKYNGAKDAVFGSDKTGGEAVDKPGDPGTPEFDNEIQEAKDYLEYNDPTREKEEWEKEQPTCMYDDGCEEQKFEQWREKKEQEEGGQGEEGEEEEDSSNSDNDPSWETNG